MKQVVVLGSGNVATHLTQALKSIGVNILQVWSRTLANAEELAQRVGAVALDRIEEVSSEADAYVFSVTDDALPHLLSQFPHREKVLLHTAGSVSIDLLQQFSPYCGVFYPLQTFSKTKLVDFKTIPLLLEASTSELEQDMLQMGRAISENVRLASSDQRKWLHISAVFSCNFVNYLYSIGEQILTDKNLSFDLIRPLIQETCDKAQHFSPGTVQTGPAIRHDHTVMDAHLDLLEQNNELKQLYKMMSDGIMKG